MTYKFLSVLEVLKQMCSELSIEGDVHLKKKRVDVSSETVARAVAYSAVWWGEI